MAPFPHYERILEKKFAKSFPLYLQFLSLFQKVLKHTTNKPNEGLNGR